jgi:branched-chain amino acid transport system substrate-binding protein
MDDDLLNGMGDAALGTVTAHMYSTAHPSAANKSFVAAYRKAFNARPGFVAVGGYDGIHLIYEALKKTGGKTDGDALVGAMKGMQWESPRGPISIDPETRDIVQNIYIRKVEKVDGELYNVEFQTFDAVTDRVKTTQAKSRPVVACEFDPRLSRLGCDEAGSMHRHNCRYCYSAAKETVARS